MPRTKLSEAVPDTMAVFKLIERYIKIERGYTVEETVERTGYSKGLYYRRSNNPKDFSLDELRRFGRILKIPPEEMLAVISAGLRFLILGVFEKKKKKKKKKQPRKKGGF